MPLPSIRVLAATPHVATVARWLHDEWWRALGWTPETVAGFLQEAAGPAPPVAYVTEVGGRPAGTATLDIDDLAARRDLSPWLASVFVAPEFRGQGIGTLLARHAIAAAQAMGQRELWLHSFTAVAFWQRFGFVVVGQEETVGRPTTLMRRGFGAPVS